MRALILGVTGQDGSYLAEQLAAGGYDVWGLTRRSTPSTAPASVQLVMGDLLDQDSLERALTNVRPDEVYNLAAVTSPGGAWGTHQPPLLADVTGVGVVRLLEAMVKCAPDAHLVHASSSAIFEPARYGLYGAAKVLAHEAVAGYRGRLHCSNAILFSHTSPRQDARFLAPRICSTLARIANGSDERLILGDVESRRDWGFAPDYCEALRLLARQATPNDWVIATGRLHSVRELVDVALTTAGLRWEEAVSVDSKLPTVPHERPIRDGRRLIRALGWAPRHSFTEMISITTEAAL